MGIWCKIFTRRKEKFLNENIAMIAMSLGIDLSNIAIRILLAPESQEMPQQCIEQFLMTLANNNTFNQKSITTLAFVCLNLFSPYINLFSLSSQDFQYDLLW